jgi:hypothetical protein
MRIARARFTPTYPAFMRVAAFLSVFSALCFLQKQTAALSRATSTRSPSGIFHRRRKGMLFFGALLWFFGLPRGSQPQKAPLCAADWGA